MSRYLNHLTTQNLDDFLASFIGLDSLMNRPFTKSTFPPYDLEKTSENNYKLVLAVAGFGKEDIKVQEKNGQITITGNKTKTTDGNFMHKGIAERNFMQSFNLAEDVKIDTVALENGLLTITLIRTEDQNVIDYEIK